MTARLGVDASGVSVAVIIPTLEEAATIETCLHALNAQMPDEVVVVDAGSADGTAERARSTGLCQVLSAPRNRGHQQNAGAHATSSHILLFLHADSRLSAGAIEELRILIRVQPRIPGGCFRMKVDDPDWRFRLIECAADARAAMLGVPYGDQAIFVTRWAFEQVGGFPEVPLMDDLYMSLRLRRLGRLVLAKSHVTTSARRWKQRGILRQSVRNWLLTAGAAAGIPPERLARAYPVVR